MHIRWQVRSDNAERLACSDDDGCPRDEVPESQTQEQHSTHCRLHRISVQKTLSTPGDQIGENFRRTHSSRSLLSVSCVNTLIAQTDWSVTDSHPSAAHGRGVPHVGEQVVGLQPGFRWSRPGRHHLVGLRVFGELVEVRLDRSSIIVRRLACGAPSSACVSSRSIQHSLLRG